MFTIMASALLAGAAVAVAFLLIALGLFSAAFDRRRRALHDRIAGTVVIRLS